jgi:hypothetical protein
MSTPHEPLGFAAVVSRGLASGGLRAGPIDRRGPRSRQSTSRKRGSRAGCPEGDARCRRPLLEESRPPPGQSVESADRNEASAAWGGSAAGETRRPREPVPADRCLDRTSARGRPYETCPAGRSRIAPACGRWGPAGSQPRSRIPSTRSPTGLGTRQELPLVEHAVCDGVSADVLDRVRLRRRGPWVGSTRSSALRLPID